MEVVGAGEGLAAYERLAARLGLAARVVFTGTHSRSEIARRIRESDLLVVPSRMETQGVVVIEALASGVPVLASDVGGIPETVIPGTGWLFPVGSVEALSEALRRLLGAHSNLDRDALVQRAAQFSRERVGERLRDVYAEVADGYRRPELSLQCGDRRNLPPESRRGPLLSGRGCPRPSTPA